MTPSLLRSFTRRTAETLCVAVVYYVAARLGLLLAFEKTNASPVWPPSGIALAAVLLLSPRVWTGVALGAFLANLQVFRTSQPAVTSALLTSSAVIALGNALEPLTGRFLFQRLIGLDSRLDRVQDVSRFVAIALAMCLVSPCIGPTGLVLLGVVPAASYGTVWFTWWLGDVVGVLVVTPLLLAWGRRASVRWSPRRLAEAVSFLALLALASQVALRGWPMAPDAGYPLAFLLTPVLLWPAFRFGPRGATMAVALVSGIAVWHTVRGYGQFVLESANASLLLTQAYVGIVTVTLLAVAASVAERRRAQHQAATQARQQAAVASLGQIAVQGGDEQLLLDRAADLVARTLGVDLCDILERQPGGGALLLRAGAGWGEGAVGTAVVEAGPGSRAALAMASGGPVFIEGLPVETGVRAERLLLDHGAVSGVNVAIPGHAARPYGVLGAHATRRRPFSEDDVRFLRSIAHVLAAALQRKKAERSVEQKNDQLTAIADAMGAFLRQGDWRQASGVLLRASLCLTGSELGLLGVLEEDPSARIIVREGGGLDAEAGQKLFESALKKYRETGRPDLGSLGELPRVVRALGMPLLRGGQAIGILVVANRPESYGGAELSTLESLAQTAGVLYESSRRLEREAVLEAQLRQSQKMDAIGQLAGGVAHDFNNLLTAIIGYADFVLERLAPEDPIARDAREIRRAAERAASLARQLLAFSRKQLLQPRVLDLNLLAAEMEKMLRRLIGEDIDLVTALDPSLGSIRADPAQLEQVLLNLALNARDAMPGGGTLTVATANVTLTAEDPWHHPGIRCGSWVTLSVSDTGIGMDAKTRARIFEPFFTTKEAGKGTGLGLATVYGVVAQSGGQIQVDSAPGQGSRFRIYLPRFEGEVDQIAAIAPPPARQRGRETILLVEDEEVLRRMTRLILERSGYTVLEAASGEEALQICEAEGEGIDLILTDVVMPGMSGWDLMNRLAPSRLGLRVLFMSGYTDHPSLLEGALDHGTAFVQKPFTPESLALKVREALDSAGRWSPRQAGTSASSRRATS